MIEIICAEDGEGFLIEMAEHGGYAEKEYYAAVRTGILTLILAETDLTRKMENEGDTEECTATVRQDSTYLYVRPREEKREMLAGSFAAAWEGFRLLAQIYPEYVRVVGISRLLFFEGGEWS